MAWQPCRCIHFAPHTAIRSSLESPSMIMIPFVLPPGQGYHEPWNPSRSGVNLFFSIRLLLPDTEVAFVRTGAQSSRAFEHNAR